jgi:hypothetical protein
MAGLKDATNTKQNYSDTRVSCTHHNTYKTLKTTEIKKFMATKMRKQREENRKWDYMYSDEPVWITEQNI